MSWTFAIAPPDDATTARTLRSLASEAIRDIKPAIGKYTPSAAPDAIVTTRFGWAHGGDGSASVHARLVTRTTALNRFMTSSL